MSENRRCFTKVETVRSIGQRVQVQVALIINKLATDTYTQTADYQGHCSRIHEAGQIPTAVAL